MLLPPRPPLPPRDFGVIALPICARGPSRPLSTWPNSWALGAPDHRSSRDGVSDRRSDHGARSTNLFADHCGLFESARVSPDRGGQPPTLAPPERMAHTTTTKLNTPI